MSFFNKANIVVETNTKYYAKLSSEDVERAIRDYFDLPSDAKIQFGIPGGGDYSNMTVDAELFKITAYWEENSEGCYE